jgi:large subunit ribosomal protein L32
MAHPKHRHSHSRSRKRRAHDALPTESLSVCPNCREMKRPHRVCPHCGFYKGKQVIEVKEEE